jgi:hypothetical protein
MREVINHFKKLEKAQKVVDKLKDKEFYMRDKKDSSIIKITGVCDLDGKQGLRYIVLWDNEGVIKTEKTRWFLKSVKRDYEKCSREIAMNHFRSMALQPRVEKAKSIFNEFFNTKVQL